MSTQLLESDFITFNIGSLLSSPTKNTQTSDEVTATKEPGSEQTQNLATKQPNFDWGAELKRRLEANKKMSPGARRREYDIETQFFKEFFSSKWDADCAKELMLMGDPLRKALKVLGFNARINPILGFISLKYVQDSLIKTKLLNSNTFKAIFNAVAKRWVADSEFFRASTYNIIYCKDLYTKSLQEIEKYLEAQSDILKPDASVYTEANQAKNKKAFLYLPSVKEQEIKKRVNYIKNNIENKKLPSVKNNKIKLNSIEFVEKYVDEDPSGGSAWEKNLSKSHLNSFGQQNLVKKLDTPAKMLAAIQFLSMNTESGEARKALQNDVLKKVSTNDLLDATKWLAANSIMPKGQLKTSDASALVLMILGNLQK